jgi:two-component system response regulator NreC
MSDGPAAERGVTRVLVVDDHSIVRTGVRVLLSSTEGFEVVGEASEAMEAAHQTRALRPDVVVLDITLKGSRSGLDVLPQIRETGARVVILSMQDEPAYARRAFEQGAQGYVVKDAADDELVDAIRAVLDDRLYVAPALGARLAFRPPDDDLTEREREILRLIALGYTNQEIAKQLYLSVRTIEAHRRHILGKLGLSTRAELVRYALERRLVSIGS